MGNNRKNSLKLKLHPIKLLKLFISITCFIITIQSFSQTTAHTVKYQAVARDADNNVYPNKDIGVLFKIIDNTNGAEVYEETHSTTAYFADTMPRVSEQTVPLSMELI